MQYIFKRNCDCCGKYYEGKGKHFCSNHCARKSDSHHRYEKGHVGYNKGKHISGSFLKCETCGKEFYRRKAWVDAVKHHYCSRKCVTMARLGKRNGIQNSNWKGGLHPRSDGHIMVYAPNHPNNIGNYIRRGRLIMEKKIGRYLTRWEVVHHLNRDPSDDRPDNLFLCKNQKEHVNKFHHSENKSFS